MYDCRLESAVKEGEEEPATWLGAKIVVLAINWDYYLNNEVGICGGALVQGYLCITVDPVFK